MNLPTSRECVSSWSSTERPLWAKHRHVCLLHRVNAFVNSVWWQLVVFLSPDQLALCCVALVDAAVVVVVVDASQLG